MPTQRLSGLVWLDHCSLQEKSHHNQKSCEWISHSADIDNSAKTIWITDYVPVFVLFILILIYSTLSRITPGNMMGLLINNWLCLTHLCSDFLTADSGWVTGIHKFLNIWFTCLFTGRFFHSKLSPYVAIYFDRRLHEYHNLKMLAI